MRCDLRFEDGHHETVEADSLRGILEGCMMKAEGIAGDDSPVFFQVFPYGVVMAEGKVSGDGLSVLARRLAVIDMDEQTFMEYAVKSLMADSLGD